MTSKRSSFKGLCVGRKNYAVLVTTGIYDELNEYMGITRHSSGLLIPDPHKKYTWRDFDGFLKRLAHEKQTIIEDVISHLPDGHPGIELVSELWEQRRRDHYKRELFKSWNYGLRIDCLASSLALLCPEESKKLQAKKNFRPADIVRALPLLQPSKFDGVVFQVASVLVDIGMTRATPYGKKYKKRLDDNQNYLPLFARRVTPVCGWDFSQLLETTRALDRATASHLQFALNGNNQGREELITGTAKGLLETETNVWSGAWESMVKRLKIAGNAKTARLAKLPASSAMSFPQHQAALPGLRNDTTCP